MEEHEQCNNLLAAQIEELTDLETLCKLKKASIEDEEDDSVKEDVSEDRPREPVTFDKLNEFTIQLKTLQVQIDALGGEYHAVTLAVGAAYDAMLSIYRKKQYQ
jgi:hypothetical protein